jgi:Na+/pantothenate symporter
VTADPLLLSIATLAALALAVGGLRRITQAERRQGVLMVVAALVLVGNVLIWAWPLDR